MSPEDNNSVDLRAGDLRLALRPDLGGSIAGLWLGDLPVLRSMEPAALAGPRQGACFPLVPYSNRLGYKRFRWLGREHTTAPNFGHDYPHSLHGSGWTRPWRITDRGERHAELMLTQLADEQWPFTFDVTQRFELSDNALQVSLHFTNIDARTQPVGLGWHPYFPKRQPQPPARGTERAAGSLTPRGPPAHAPRAAARHRRLSVASPQRSTTASKAGAARRASAMKSDVAQADHVVAALPGGVHAGHAQDYFCVEPVSHVSNAIHMADPAGPRPEDSRCPPATASTAG